MRQVKRRVILFCLLILEWTGNALAIDPAAYTIDAIRERWHARQEQVKSLRIKWHQTRIFRTTRRSAEMWHGDPNSPSGYATLAYDMEVQIDGDKIEYRSESADAIRHNESPSIRETYDGKRSQTFNVAPNDSKSGFVNGEQYSSTKQSLPLFPLYWAFRPLHVSMGAFRLDTATILPHAGTIDEQDQCVILRQNVNTRSQRELWLDPKLEFLPRRFVDTVDGVPKIKLDIAYGQDAKLGPLPNFWKFVWLDAKGELFDTNEATVVEYEINPSIPPAAFQIEFPPGTLVADSINGTRYVAGSIETPRPVTPNSRWLLLLLSAFGLIALIVFFLRRRPRTSDAS